MEASCASRQGRNKNGARYQRHGERTYSGFYDRRNEYAGSSSGPRIDYTASSVMVSSP